MDNQTKGLKGGLFGILSTLVGLSLGNVIAKLNHNWNNPVVSLGNRVVDHVPSSIKEFAIRTFGVNDKTFLISTIVIVVILLSIYLGRSYFSDRELAARAIVIAMTVAASIAALFDPHSTPFSILPSVATGMATFLTLRWIRKQVRSSSEMDSGRRDLFRVVGVVGAATLAATGLGKILQQNTSVQVERIKLFLPKAKKFLPKPPLDPALRTPGLSALFTPNDKFYRIDTALSTPNISIDTWTLQINGMVSNPKTFTYAELMSRPTFELDDTISCVSNEVGGNLVGNARWFGIRLDDLIRESGPTSRADQVMGYSTDGFTAGFPLAALDGRDAMIAFGMNGEVLPIEHGYPARIIVPGLYGYVSATKWLTRIELTRFDQKQGYWVPRGWSAQAPIKTQSRIDTPFDGFTIKPGPRAVAGVAWAPTRGISKVEVKIGSDLWREATLGPELAKTTWRQWWIDWSPKSGNYQISVRATDGNGDLQSRVNVPVEPNGAEGWHTIVVHVN